MNIQLTPPKPLLMRINEQLAELHFNLAGVPGSRALLETLAREAEASAGLNEGTEEARRDLLASGIFPNSNIGEPSEFESTEEDCEPITGLLQGSEPAVLRIWSPEAGVIRIPIRELDSSSSEVELRVAPLVESLGMILSEMRALAASKNPEEQEGYLELFEEIRRIVELAEAMLINKELNDRAAVDEARFERLFTLAEHSVEELKRARAENERLKEELARLKGE